MEVRKKPGFLSYEIINSSGKDILRMNVFETSGTPIPSAIIVYEVVGKETIGVPEIYPVVSNDMPLGNDPTNE